MSSDCFSLAAMVFKCLPVLLYNVRVFQCHPVGEADTYHAAVAPPSWGGEVKSVFPFLSDSLCLSSSSFVMLDSSITFFLPQLIKGENRKGFTISQNLCKVIRYHSIWKYTVYTPARVKMKLWGALAKANQMAKALGNIQETSKRQPRFLKYPTEKIPPPPLRPPSKATPPKHMNAHCLTTLTAP